jgi:hypothetical protein
MKYALCIMLNLETKTFANTAQPTANLIFYVARQYCCGLGLLGVSGHIITMNLIAACALFHWARGLFDA